MKVLWFEVTTPQNFSKNETVVGGWQDALEHVVKKTGIELVVAFTSSLNKDTTIVDGVVYEPINLSFSFLQKQRSRFSWNLECERILGHAKRIVAKHNPDLSLWFYIYKGVSCLIIMLCILLNIVFIRCMIPLGGICGSDSLSGVRKRRMKRGCGWKRRCGVPCHGIWGARIGIMR